MPRIIRRDLLMATAAVAAQSAVVAILPSWAAARGRSNVAHYPTLLGTGGHSTGGQDFPAGSYFGNVGLGRDLMETNGLTDESQAKQPIRVPGTISNLWWGLPSGSGQFSALTLSLNRNSTPELSVSFDNYTSGWATDTSNFAVVAGDQLSFEASVGAEVANFVGAFYCASAQFVSSDSTIQSAQMLATVGSSDIYPTDTQKFASFLGILGTRDIAGDQDADPTESDQQFKCLTAGRWRNMACNVATNAFIKNTIITNRITNAVSAHDGNMSLNVLPNTSGYFEDTSDHDDVNVGNLLDYGIRAGHTTGNFGSTHLTMDWIGCHFVASTPSQCMIGGMPTDPGGTVVIRPGITRHYSSLFGGGNDAANEARSTGTLPYDALVSEFSNHIVGWQLDQGGTAAAATFNLLRNDTNGQSTPILMNSITSEVTGWFTATGDPYQCESGDTITNQIYTPGTPVNNLDLVWGGASLLVQAS